jgi:hypothetical protein
MKRALFSLFTLALLASPASALTSTSDLSSNWPSRDKMQREEALELGLERAVRVAGQLCMMTTAHDRMTRCMPDLQLVHTPICNDSEPALSGLNFVCRRSR